MKHLLFFILITLPLLGVTGEKTARIHGSLKRLNAPDKIALKYDGVTADISDYGSMGIPVDADGHFDIVISLEKPGYYSIHRNFIYLSPGDNLEVDIDENCKLSTFKGKGAVVSNYLRNRAFSHGGSFLESGVHAHYSQERMITFVDSMAQLRVLDLKALKGVTREFREMERARITADVINSLYYYRTYHSAMVLSKGPREELLKFWNDYMASVKERIQPLLHEISRSDNYLEIEIVRVVLSVFSRDNLFTVQLSERCKALMEVAGQSRRISGNLSGEEFDRLQAYAQGIKYTDFQEAFLNKLAKNSKLTPGKPAFDSEGSELAGASKRLSDLKGKAIYVDVWATWCMPCIGEAPHFLELSKQFPGIQFVAFSVDENRKAWENYVSKKEHGDILEWLSLDPDFRSKWDIVGIPRFILIDKDFNIISADAPRPSDRDKIIPLLEKYIQ